jgi:hypothetical protein
MMPAHVLRVRSILPLFLQSLFAVGTTCSLRALLLEQVQNVWRNMTTNMKINETRRAYITT